MLTNIKNVRADEVRETDWILDAGRWLYVESISSNSLGDVVLRCATDEGSYPGLSLMLRPDELVGMEK